MTKREWVEAVNAAIGNDRNNFAADRGARAEITADGRLQYVDRLTPGKYERRISLQELFSIMHGKDIRALKASRVAA